MWKNTAYMLDENLKHTKKQNKQIFLFWTLRNTKSQNIIFYESSLRCFYKQRCKTWEKIIISKITSQANRLLL